MNEIKICPLSVVLNLKDGSFISRILQDLDRLKAFPYYDSLAIGSTNICIPPEKIQLLKLLLIK